MRLDKPPFAHLTRRALTIFSAIACLSGLIALFVTLWIVIRRS
jgi:hypothetical protein